jgi:hypothetical protein
MLVFGGVSYAAGVFDKEVTATANIKASTPGITFYTDSSCTIEISTLDFGQVASGESVTIHPYLKNTGNKNLTGIVVSSNLDATIGSISVAGLGATPQNTGYIIPITLHTVESTSDINSPIIITFSGSY